MITKLAIDLIKIPSITPDDGGCIRLICNRLEPAGFKASHLRYGDVDNLWLVHGTGDPVLCFLGHTDVVPPGPTKEWDSDPFLPEVQRNDNETTHETTKVQNQIMLSQEYIYMIIL